MEKKYKQDKGVAGLTIFLSLVVMLFIIGLIIMIFSLMGSELQVATYDSTTGAVTMEKVTGLSNTTGDYLTVYALRNVVCTVSAVMNYTSNITITDSNYTMTNCLIKADDGASYTDMNVAVNYTYVYNKDNTATFTMNDTISGISGATSWFDIFVVIGAMVVLILLTVIIITAIRSSGMVSGEVSKANAAGKVGTA